MSIDYDDWMRRVEAEMEVAAEEDRRIWEESVARQDSWQRHLRYMRAVILVVAVLGLVTFACVAFAGTGRWYQDDRWTVVGDSDRDQCLARTVYTTGVGLSLLRTDEGWSMVIDGVSSVLGNVYRVRAETSDGDRLHFVGLGLGSGAVMFEGLTSETLVALSRSRGLWLQGVGGLMLTGSGRAIKELSLCYSAMKG